MEWIDVKKKLPTPWKDKLVCNSKGNVYITKIVMQDPQGNFIWHSEIDSEHEEITHWMDLPLSPVEDRPSYACGRPTC